MTELARRLMNHFRLHRIALDPDGEQVVGELRVPQLIPGDELEDARAPARGCGAPPS